MIILSYLKAGHHFLNLRGNKTDWEDEVFFYFFQINMSQITLFDDFVNLKKALWPTTTKPFARWGRDTD